MATGVSTLDKTIQETNILLKDIGAELGWGEDKEISYNLLRAVLHTLRDRLTIDEASELAAQLPTLVRGIYYEGWVPPQVPRKMDKEAFLSEVRDTFPLSTEHSIESLIQGVIRCLRKYVSDGELENIKDNLPKDLSSVITV